METLCHPIIYQIKQHFQLFHRIFVYDITHTMFLSQTDYMKSKKKTTGVYFNQDYNLKRMFVSLPFSSLT